MIIKKNGDLFKLMEGAETIYSTPDLLTAACIMRFVKAGRLEKPEYMLAITAMKKGREDNNVDESNAAAEAIDHEGNSR